MEVILAKNNGFCFGVKNALDKSLDLVGDNIYFLGELVHNKETIKAIEGIGKIVSDIEDVPDGATLVVRAHGVSTDIYKRVRDKKLKIVDLTCPKVRKIHEMVEQYNNHFIIIIGKKDHPEILGTISFAKRYVLISNEDEIDDLYEEIDNYKDKIYVFSQTTFSKEKYDKIVEKLKNTFYCEFEFVSCICPTTEIRQKEVERLSKEVDLMIIIGGKNSSNTNKLYEIAVKNTDCLLIENEDEIDIEKVKKYNKVGISSGASTNMDCVLRIKKYLENC